MHHQLLYSSFHHWDHYQLSVWCCLQTHLVATVMIFITRWLSTSFFNRWITSTLLSDVPEELFRALLLESHFWYISFLYYPCFWNCDSCSYWFHGALFHSVRCLVMQLYCWHLHTPLYISSIYYQPFHQYTWVGFASSWFHQRCSPSKKSKRRKIFCCF